MVELALLGVMRVDHCVSNQYAAGSPIYLTVLHEPLSIASR